MSSYKVKKTAGNTEWFRNDRFGMFIHFGLYSMPARHEWIKNYESISEEKYDKYFEHFNPDLYDPREWARAAKLAGMKYAVLTTKHHEGFCLFDSKYTDYKVTNTPYGKDIVKEYVEAFRAEGLKVGFYYSLIDWNHKDFPIDLHHPRRHDANAKDLDKGRDMHKYCEYMRNQVTELLTNYGKIDILWFDFSYKRDVPDAYDIKNTYDWMPFGGMKGKEEWEAEELIATARKYQPEIIIDNRTGLEQDIFTPEQFQPDRWVTDDKGNLVTWEACQTFSGSWGYHRDELTWKSSEQLVNMLIDTVSLGGNLIMNVGPTARGCFDSRAVSALDAYANWMKYNNRSIYGCTMAEPEFSAPNGARLTQSEDGKRLYVHLQKYPFGYIAVENLAGKIDYAQFLHDGSEVRYSEDSFTHFLGDSEGLANQKGSAYFKLPTVKPDTIVPVIEIFLK